MRSDLQFVLAGPDNEPELRKLLRDNPVSGSIRVALEREPNAFHAAAVSGDHYDLILGYGDSGRTFLGAGARFELDTYINGEVQRIGYLGEFRIDGGLKQRRTLLLESYRALRRYHEAGKTPFYLTTIIADNTTTRRLLEAGLGDMPAYKPLETMVTFTISAKRAARGRVSTQGIETGSTETLPEISSALRSFGRSYQFHPVWNDGTLRSAERCRGLAPQDFLLRRNADGLAGCLALWDQRAFKQTVVAGYDKRLARLRPAFNLLAPLLRQPRLPAAGARLESAFLSHLAVDPDDGDTLVELIRHASRNAIQRGLDYVMIAFAERNPLTEVIRKRFSCHSYVSMVYVVYWEDGEIAASTLDERMPHPEVAIL